MLSFLPFPHLVDEAHTLAKRGVSDAPVANGLSEERFDVRVFFYLVHQPHLYRLLQRRSVELVRLQHAEGSKVGAALQANVAHECAARCQAKSSCLVNGYFPTYIPRDGTSVEALEAREHSSILHSVHIGLCHAFQSFLLRLVVDKMFLPSVSPCSPSPARHVGREIEGWCPVIRYGETQIGESCYVHHPFDILIYLKGLIHVSQIVGRGAYIVFKHYDAVV